MLTTNIFDIPDQYQKVLEGCRKNNAQSILRALRTLIRKTKQSRHLSRELVQLYSLCVIYLNIDRIPDVMKIFDRLLRGWKAIRANYASRTYIKRAADIEIEDIENRKIRFITSDPIIPDIVQNIKEIEPTGTLKQLSQDVYTWDITARRRVLPSVLCKLRTPQYLDFLKGIHSNQLIIDF